MEVEQLLLTTIDKKETRMREGVVANHEEKRLHETRCGFPHQPDLCGGGSRRLGQTVITCENLSALPRPEEFADSPLPV